MTSICTKLDWDSRFFGLPVYRCLADEGIDKLPQWIESFKGTDALCYIISSEALDGEMLDATTHPFQAKLMDTRVVFGKNVSSIGLPASVQSISASTEKLIDLGIQSGAHSRFRIDPKISHHKFMELYTLWVTNALQRSFADEVFHFLGEDGESQGIVTLSQNKQGHGEIGLIAVDEHDRGKGIGRALMHAAEHYFHGQGIGQVEVATQENNKAACAFYARLGYAIQKIEYIYHLWIN